MALIHFADDRFMLGLPIIKKAKDQIAYSSFDLWLSKINSDKFILGFELTEE